MLFCYSHERGVEAASEPVRQSAASPFSADGRTDQQLCIRSLYCRKTLSNRDIPHRLPLCYNQTRKQRCFKRKGAYRTMKLQLGKTLKRLRREKDITQEELAEILGVSFQSVSRWELGVSHS